jgi:hypothetical protein
MTEVSSGFGGFTGLSRTGVSLAPATERSSFCFLTTKEMLTGDPPLVRQ